MPNLQQLRSQLTAGDDQLAESAVHQLVDYGPDALPDLCDLAASSDSDTRWWALRTLALIPAPQVLIMLQEGLHDEDLAVRQCAALGLKHQPSKAAIPDLIAALSDKDQLFARLAADALTAIGTEAVPALCEILQRESSPARMQAARALALLEDQRAIPSLFAALDDDSLLVQHWAEEGLTRLGVGMTFFSPH